MRHYNLWLEKYNRKRDELLSELEAHGRHISKLKGSLPLEKLFHEIPDSGGEYGKYCFVDGGEGIRELVGCSVYFIKSSGLVMEKDRKDSHKFVRELDMGILGYDDYTKDRVELMRDAMEFSTAVKCIREHQPGMLFLDGSLYVKANRARVNCPEFETYVKKFSELIGLCRAEGIKLVGVSEDSKSRIFKQYIESTCNVKFPEFITDPTLLELLASKANEVFVTEKFVPHSEHFTSPTVYIKPTRVSTPLRVDVLDGEKDFDGIIKTIVDLSRGSRGYGYPLPLYLVHLDARIERKHADWSVNQMVNYIRRKNQTLWNALLKKRRRESRPGE
ncbi:MAG: DNA double-strand break repair nuclease NurA [Candidatus Altiarchaeota archaeon]